VMATGNIIGLADLPPELRGEAPQGSRQRAPPADREATVEIKRALTKARGDREKAAELLQMSRATLWRKMKEHRIQWPRKRRTPKA